MFSLIACMAAGSLRTVKSSFSTSAVEALLLPDRM
jgi:hypothetical protein